MILNTVRMLVLVVVLLLMRRTKMRFGVTRMVELRMMSVEGKLNEGGEWY